MLHGHICTTACIDGAHHDIFLVADAALFQSNYYRDRYHVTVESFVPSQSGLTPQQILDSHRFDADVLRHRPVIQCDATRLRAYDVVFRDTTIL